MQHLAAGRCHTMYMNDAELINQILKGNSNAFELLVNRYQKLVVHITLRIIQRQEDMEDVCQEVFLKIYENLKKYRHECKLSTWIATIAYNTSLNHLRRYKNDQVKSDDPLSFERTTDVRIDEYEKADLYQYIRKQIDQLPLQYRTVLTLYHLDEFSYQEVEQITGMPEGTIKNYLFRAKAQLKEKLKFVVDENSLKFVEEISHEK